MLAKTYRPVVLCILDGWGLRAERADNAIALARAPQWEAMTADRPCARLEASERHVGLPDGQMGNSEVGHMNLGAGRRVLQDLPRIDRAVETGELARNPALIDMLQALKAAGGRVHLMGLLSPGGVHAHQDQMAALARIIGDSGTPVLVHAFLDGRDTPPKSAGPYLDAFQAAAPSAPIASVSGRYYAMDRDGNWDRVEPAYRAMVAGEGPRAPSARAALETAYSAGTGDEFVTPTVIGSYTGFRPGDAIVMANFRADRARQILEALTAPDFDGFARGPAPELSAAVGMVSYSSALDARLRTLFPPEGLKNVMGAVLAERGLTQLRIAETEKYAHVTFFFNGGEERVFPGEERILVPSPKVATYDLKPEMSALEVTDKLVEAIASDRFDFIVVNYANTDMVGHSGDLDAAIKAVETVDACLGRLRRAVEDAGGALIVTADHGNAEQMRDPATGQAHTAHSTNPVPFVLVGAGAEIAGLDDGVLADVAPTCLELMGVEQPKEMTGRSLIARKGVRAAE